MGQTSEGAVDASPVPGLDVAETEKKLFALSQLLLKEPERPEYLLQKGVYLTELGRLRVAFDIFERLQTDFPEHPAPYANLAAIYARWGRLEEARQMLLKSDSLTANRHLTQMNLASVNLALALAALNKASELKPTDAGTQMRLRSLEKYLADSTAAMAPIVKSQEFSPAAQTESPSPLQAQTRIRMAAASGKNERTLKTPDGARDRLTLGTLEDVNLTEMSSGTAGGESKKGSAATLSQSDKSAIVKAIETWREAWTRKSYDDYMACYSNSFQPSDGGTRDGWARRKQVLMDKAKYIQLDVKISAIQLDRQTATVRLTQKYSSNRYKDQVVKELKLQLENSKWMILAETQIN
jgi:tetratricopeptide (TPR) repeat protein